MEDLGHLPAEDSYDANIDQFQLLWENEVTAHGLEKASLGRIFILLVWKKLFKAFLVYCCVMTCTMLGPVSLIIYSTFIIASNKLST